MRLTRLVLTAGILAVPTIVQASPLYVVVQNMSRAPMQVKATVPNSNEVVTVISLQPGESGQIHCGEKSGVALSVMRERETSWRLAYSTGCWASPTPNNIAKLW
jgi:hypothetical protein